MNNEDGRNQIQKQDERTEQKVEQRRLLQPMVLGGNMITTNRIYKAYARINRKIRWQYSDYCGRWESIEKAVSEVTERYSNQDVEYRIENMVTDEVVTGIVRI